MSGPQQRVILSMVLPSLSAAAERALEDRPLPPELGQPQFRRQQAAIAKDGYDAANHTITLAVSSEFPVERYGGVEILRHGKENVETSRLDRGISHLFNHNWDVLLGRSQSYELRSKQLWISSKFGTNQAIRDKEQDVADGIMPDVSIGYQPLKINVIEDKNGNRTYDVVLWMPLEFSSVTVPADYTVGLDRSAPREIHVEVNFRKLDDDDTDDEDERRKREVAPAQPVTDPVAAPHAAEPIAADPEPTPADTPSSAPTPTEPTQRIKTMADVADVKDLLAERNARQSALFTFRNLNPKFYPEGDLQRDLASDESIEVIGKRVSEAVIKGHQGNNVRSAADQAFDDMPKRDQEQYSLRNALAATINQRFPGTFKDKGAEAGLEREFSAKLEKTLGARGIAATGNILVPSDLGRRSLVAGGNAGATTINTETSSEVIDMLRARCRVMAMGVQTITMDTGLLRLPRQTGTSQSQWLAELAGANNTDATLDTISFSPKRNGIVGSYTLELLAQSGLDVEAFIRADQLASKARTYDAVILGGTGANGMPLGLLNMTGPAVILTGSTRAADGTVTAGAGGKPVTFVDINNFEAALSNINADTGSLGWLYTPKVRAAMRSTAKFPGTGGFMPLLPDSATGADGLQEGPLGYKAGVTTNGLPTNGTVGSATNLHTMILGVFSNLIIASWGVSELTYDRVTGAKQGIHQIIENEFMDVNCTHPEGFAISTTVLAA